MPRYFLKLSYKGTNFNGWQIQPNVPSIQQTLQESLSKLLKQPIWVVGAGRTDTGVHAAYYVAHFDVEQPISQEYDKFCYHLNCTLPRDIAVSGIEQVADDAHARFDAVRREYKYYASRVKSPFNIDLVTQITFDPDIDLMNAAAMLLFEYEDFTSFSKLHSDNKTNICKIYEARWERQGDMYIFTISADRFLRDMVRAIVGTLFNVGKGKLTLEDFRRIIEEKNRQSASSSAPAQGLFLTNVVY